MRAAIQCRSAAALVLAGLVAAALPAHPARADLGYAAHPARADLGYAGHAASSSPGPWQEPDATVEAPPSEVVAQAAPLAGPSTALRIVTVQDRAGRPDIGVERVLGRAEAVETVAEAQARPGVVAVSVDTRVHALGTPRHLTAGGSDPLRGEQWALDRLAAESVWGLASGAAAVVAVVDSGVDGTHPDLAGQLTAAGYDFVTGGGDGRLDEHSHGTHVAGVVAAVQGNSAGVTGLAPRARIMPVRVLDAAGAGWSSAIAEGIVYAVDHGADVVNLSLGGPHADPATASAVSYAVSRGVTVVAAAGNERLNGNATSYPAALPGVIAVASLERDDTSSPFSNTGDYVDVAAPGGGILSTVRGGYGYMSGTSMAAPFVAATAALAVDATRGAATAAQLDRALTGTALDLGAAGRDPVFGHGLVSPYRAVCSLTGCDRQSPAQQPAPAPEPQPEPAPVAPTPDDEPAPEDEPAVPALREVRVAFAGGGGAARVGQRGPVHVRVTDTRDGSPVAGQRVVLLGRHGGGVVVRRWVVTDDAGEATAAFRIRATTRFTGRSPATASTAAARSAGSVLWRAVPRVHASHVDRRAIVRVVDDRGQRVVFQAARGGRWVPVRVTPLDPRGRAVVRNLPRGRYRATVTRVPGLTSVRTAPWTVR